MPSSSPSPQPNWPTMNLTSSSQLQEANLSLKVSDPFPHRWMIDDRYTEASTLGSPEPSSPTSPTTRLHHTGDAWQTGHRHHGQLCEWAHSGGDASAGDQRCRSDLQPKILPEPAQSHRSGPTLKGLPFSSLSCGIFPTCLSDLGSSQGTTLLSVLGGPTSKRGRTVPQGPSSCLLGVKDPELSLKCLAALLCAPRLHAGEEE